MFNDKIDPDRFDDERQAWIKRHAWPVLATTQKKRAQILSRQRDDRSRQAAGGRPDPNDSNVILPLFFRRPTTFEGGIENVVVGVALLLAPVGFFLGWTLYRRFVAYIPERLRAYPIPAMLWTGAVIGTWTAILYHFLHDSTSLVSAFVAPYLIAQIPATFATAGIFGILNGWLAVDGSTDLWPVRPAALPVDVDLPMRAEDLTSPPPIETAEVDNPMPDMHPLQVGATSRRLVVWGLIACAAGSAWMVGAVLIGVKDALMHPLATDYVASAQSFRI